VENTQKLSTFFSKKLTKNQHPTFFQVAKWKFKNIIKISGPHFALTTFSSQDMLSTICSQLQKNTEKNGENTIGATPYCNTLQYTATHCNTLQHTATLYNTLQHSAIYCNTLHHTATDMSHAGS